MDKTSGRALWRGQLTARGVVIGCIGCVVITASSAYTALKLGALPWPIVFAAIVSLFFLKLLGNASLNEANVTHTIMSAGAMVAGGLAFTIPGAWMLGYADEVGFAQMLIVALAGTGLGLVATAIIHRHFIVDTDLEFPMGASAAQTLRATEAGGKTGRRLFASMGLAGAYAVMVSVGFLVGGVAVAWWFAGALLANFGIVVAGSAAGLWSVDAAQGIVKSLGMGLMMGAGLAVVAKDILPQLAGIARGVQGAGSNGGEDAAESLVSGNVRTDAGTFAVVAAAIVVLMCMGLGLPPVVSIVVVLLAFVTTAMSAQSCGQTGIDPMEIFGLIVLLLVSAFAQIREVQLFFIAGVVAVACGLAGDVMNDFKAGSILGTDPRAQWLGQAIGGVLGAVISAAVMMALVSAYGPDAFGLGKDFVSAQASVVATMVSGIPSVPGFVIGLAAGVALYWAGLPAMMLGLGVYLPFYMSFTATLGAALKWAIDRVRAARIAGLPEDERSARDADAQEAGVVIASGVLGGESIVGVIIAMVSVIAGLAA